MDFGLALTFQFKDPDWVRKLLLASLITLIPVVGWVFVFGWSLEVSRQVIKGDGHALPEIDLARDLVRGLEGFIINLVYNLPAIVVSAGMTFLLIFTSAVFIIILAALKAYGSWPMPASFPWRSFTPSP